MSRTEPWLAGPHALGRLLVLGGLLIGGCARQDPRVTLAVGAATLRLAPPPGWDHVDNGGWHQFRNGDQRMVLRDVGIAMPETLAAVIHATRHELEREKGPNELTSASWGEDPVLAARSLDERRSFWRYWNAVSYDPTRSAEMRWAVDTLVARSRALRPLGPQELARCVIRSTAWIPRRPRGESGGWHAPGCEPHMNTSSVSPVRSWPGG